MSVSLHNNNSVLNSREQKSSCQKLFSVFGQAKRTYTFQDPASACTQIRIYLLNKKKGLGNKPKKLDNKLKKYKTVFPYNLKSKQYPDFSYFSGLEFLSRILLSAFDPFSKQKAGLCSFRV